MKKIIYVFAISAFFTSAMILGCNSPAKKVENAKMDVAEANNEVAKANNDLDKANADYLADVANYKKETADKLAANELSIKEFDARIASQKKDAKVAYKQKVALIEKKNTDLKKKMDEYKEEGKDKWDAFKIEFSHDMDELGKAMNDLTVNNVK